MDANITGYLFHEFLLEYFNEGSQQYAYNTVLAKSTISTPIVPQMVIESPRDGDLLPMNRPVVMKGIVQGVDAQSVTKSWSIVAQASTPPVNLKNSDFLTPADQEWVSLRPGVLYPGGSYRIHFRGSRTGLANGNASVTVEGSSSTLVRVARAPIGGNFEVCRPVGRFQTDEDCVIGRVEEEASSDPDVCVESTTAPSQISSLSKRRGGYRRRMSRTILGSESQRSVGSIQQRRSRRRMLDNHDDDARFFTRDQVSFFELALSGPGLRGFSDSVALKSNGKHIFLSPYNNGEPFGTVVRVDTELFDPRGSVRVVLSAISPELVGFSAIYSDLRLGAPSIILYS